MNEQPVTGDRQSKTEPHAIERVRAANEYAALPWTLVDPVDDIRMAWMAGSKWEREHRELVTGDVGEARKALSGWINRYYLLALKTGVLGVVNDERMTLTELEQAIGAAQDALIEAVRVEEKAALEAALVDVVVNDQRENGIVTMLRDDWLAVKAALVQRKRLVEEKALAASDRHQAPPLEYDTWRPALRALIERMVQFGVRVGAESVAGEPWPAEVWQRAEAQTDVVEAIQALVTEVCLARDAQWRKSRDITQGESARSRPPLGGSQTQDITVEVEERSSLEARLVSLQGALHNYEVSPDGFNWRVLRDGIAALVPDGAHESVQSTES